MPNLTSHIASIHNANDSLTLAVLEEAVQTFQRGIRSSDPQLRKQFLEVSRWVASDDRNSPFAFENICERLGLDPGYIRRGLAELARQAYRTNPDQTANGQDRYASRGASFRRHRRL